MKHRIAKYANLVFLLLGMGLLAGMLLRLDPNQVFDHLGRIGWWFGLAFGVYVLAVMCSSAAWFLMVDPAAGRVRYRHFLAALWAGHAVNMVTPAASVGELYKATMMKGRIEGRELVASLMTFNFLSTLVTQLFTMLAPLVCLLMVDFPAPVIWALFGTASLFFLPVVGLYVLLRFGAAGKLVKLAAKLPLVRFRDPEALLAKARAIDERVQSFPRRQPGRFALALALLAAVRLLQVAEVWVLLRALMPEQGAGWLLLLALASQTASQLIAWLMTFVPSQVGVAESGSAWLFQTLALDPMLGFAMELARRLRKVLGTAIGLAIGSLAPRWRGVDRPEKQWGVKCTGNVAGTE